MYKEFYSETLKPEVPDVDYEVSIHLKDRTPIHYQPRRLCHIKKNAIKDINFGLLDKGIIRESKSEYCSPIVLIKKKYNNYCMSTNLKELNKRVVKEHYHISHIDE